MSLFNKYLNAMGDLALTISDRLKFTKNHRKGVAILDFHNIERSSLVKDIYVKTNKNM